MKFSDFSENLLILRKIFTVGLWQIDSDQLKDFQGRLGVFS